MALMKNSINENQFQFFEVISNIKDKLSVSQFNQIQNCIPRLLIFVFKFVKLFLLFIFSEPLWNESYFTPKGKVSKDHK